MMVISFGLVCVIPNHTNVLYVYPYFVMGYMIHENGILDGKHKMVDIMWIVGWVVLLLMYKKEDFIYLSGILPNFNKLETIKKAIMIDIYRWLIGFVGSMAVIKCAQYISTYFTSNIAILWLKKIGKYTLDIYVMQRLALEIFLAKVFEMIVVKIGANYLTKNLMLFYLMTILFSIIFTSILVYIAELIEKNNVMSLILFGKRIKR